MKSLASEYFTRARGISIPSPVTPSRSILEWWQSNCTSSVTLLFQLVLLQPQLSHYTSLPRAKHELSSSVLSRRINPPSQGQQLQASHSRGATNEARALTKPQQQQDQISTELGKQNLQFPSALEKKHTSRQSHRFFKNIKIKVYNDFSENGCKNT